MTVEELERDSQSTFIIMYDGWERDGMGWIMADGRVFTTSHGLDVVEMNELDIEMKIKVTAASLAGLRCALAAIKNKE